MKSNLKLEILNLKRQFEKPKQLGLGLSLLTPRSESMISEFGVLVQNTFMLNAPFDSFRP